MGDVLTAIVCISDPSIIVLSTMLRYCGTSQPSVLSAVTTCVEVSESYYLIENDRS